MRPDSKQTHCLLPAHLRQFMMNILTFILDPSWSCAILSLSVISSSLHWCPKSHHLLFSDVAYLSISEVLYINPPSIPLLQYQPPTLHPLIASILYTQPLWESSRLIPLNIVFCYLWLNILQWDALGSQTISSGSVVLLGLCSGQTSSSTENVPFISTWWCSNAWIPVYVSMKARFMLLVQNFCVVLEGHNY